MQVTDVIAPVDVDLKPTLHLGLSSMRKGFSSLMTSIDSALKPIPDDISDTISIRSDASSDSENYVVVNMEAQGRTEQSVDATFKVAEFHYEALEVASEVLEEESTITTTSDRSLTSSCRRKDLVRAIETCLWVVSTWV